jgi:hypothetical protein
MYDRYMIVGEEFRNVEQDGKVTGFQIGARLPYYRGVVLSILGPTGLSVDGEHFAPEDITVTLHGNTYKLTELQNQDEDRWEFGEVGILTVNKPGGLAPGRHEVELDQQLMITYVLPRGFKGHDRKVLEMAG